eukprot:6476275-Amphidinium_carterae.1
MILGSLCHRGALHYSRCSGMQLHDKADAQSLQSCFTVFTTGRPPVTKQRTLKSPSGHQR